MRTHFNKEKNLNQVISEIEKRIGGYRVLLAKITKEIKFFYHSLSVENGLKPKLIIGLSGGIDSSLVAFLAVRAIGVKNVICVGMPRDEKDEALVKFKLVAKKLNLPISNQFLLYIKPIVEQEILLINKCKGIKINNRKENQSEMDRMRIGNLSSRARVAILYDIQRRLNGRVLGTGNRTEYVQGYAAKYGTPISYDFGILDELYKIDIYHLAALVGMPSQIIEAKPTTGYFEEQTHENELGASMHEQDALAFLLFERHLSPKAISGKYAVAADFITLMQARFTNSAHKRMLKQPHIRLGLIKND